MADPTFETMLAGRLREYAEGGVRPMDRYALAEGIIATGRPTGRWGWTAAIGRRSLMPLVVGLLLAALVGGAVLVGGRLLARPQPPHRYAHELIAAPELSLPMAYPTLVALRDGTVLVIGTEGGGVPRGTRALVYDPVSGVSQTTGPLVSGPSSELGLTTAVQLDDGRVLLIGSVEDRPVAQMFDPSTRQFTATRLLISPAMAGVARLPDGRVLIAGGYPSGTDAATSSAELLDPDSMTLSFTGSMGTSRSLPSLVTLPDGRVFVSPGDSRYTVETYDPRTGTFSDAGTMASYGYGKAIALQDGRVVVIGGTSLSRLGFVQVWDPASKTFSPEQRLPGSLVRGTATLLDDGRILLLGGEPGNWSGIYDPTTGVTTPIPETRTWKPGAVRLADGRVLIVGGLRDGETPGGIPAPGVTTVQIFQ